MGKLLCKAQEIVSFTDGLVFSYDGMLLASSFMPSDQKNHHENNKTAMLGMLPNATRYLHW